MAAAGIAGDASAGGASAGGALAGGVGAMREMHDTSARLQEGELHAVRKLLAASERKQQALIEQLASERMQFQAAQSEAAKLHALSAEYAALSERHSAALEMLGSADVARLELEPPTHSCAAPLAGVHRPTIAPSAASDAICRCSWATWART